MRVRITAKTSLFYGEEGEVIRSTHGRFGEPQFTVHFDRSKETGGPFALPFFGWEICSIDSEAEVDTIEAHYYGLEKAKWLRGDRR
jgi:hypothetical protein